METFVGIRLALQGRFGGYSSVHSRPQAIEGFTMSLNLTFYRETLKNCITNSAAIQIGMNPALKLTFSKNMAANGII